jgi:transcriptional regulator GlxA family with amidase domain
MASNCSGALVLAEAGVLDGKLATTWAGGEASFQKKYPNVLVQHDINVVIDDGVLTSNGSVVSYEAAIALLAKLTSDEFAAEVANDLQFKRVAKCCPAAAAALETCFRHRCGCFPVRCVRCGSHILDTY